MSRAGVSVVVAMLIAGCSVSQSSYTASLNGGDDGTAGAIASSRATSQAGLGAEPNLRSSGQTSRSAGRQSVAMLNDRAPKGSFDKAPRGALSDRDYSRTVLKPEMARDLINAYRRQNGLRPLRLNATLTDAAKAHSRDLAKWDRISHFGSDGSNPWDRVKRAGFNARLAAENVGTGQATFAEVLKGWKDSPGHNKNLLLTDATHMGIALEHDGRTEFKTFWTLVLATPL